MKATRKDGKISKAFVRFMSKKYTDYGMSVRTDIFQAYAKPSDDKVIAFEYHKRRALNHQIRILGSNSWNFSVAYLMYENYTVIFVYATKTHTFEIPIEMLR